MYDVLKLPKHARNNILLTFLLIHPRNHQSCLCQNSLAQVSILSWVRTKRKVAFCFLFSTEKVTSQSLNARVISITSYHFHIPYVCLVHSRKKNNNRLQMCSSLKHAADECTTQSFLLHCCLDPWHRIENKSILDLSQQCIIRIAMDAWHSIWGWEWACRLVTNETSTPTHTHNRSTGTGYISSLKIVILLKWNTFIWKILINIQGY